ncbi:gonadotropin subunit beta-1-like [Clinocottus analis]|uniref:gonadotropin subunit beta-1-like n=1 Tax=Clinocottus analis TaxID=304258 RepID=UPI0035C018D7
MQLVVMAAVLVLALAGAGHGCSFRCRLTNVRLPMESCGRTEYIHTTICAGQCENQDSVFISKINSPEQNMCIGDWDYEVKHINGCPEGVTYPVATKCDCKSCDPDENTDCARFNGDASSCLSF